LVVQVAGGWSGSFIYFITQALTISTPGIKKLVNNINPHKATGPDNISGRVLKELQEKTASIVNLIFTKSFHTEQTHIDWKTANVAPAFKKGDKHKAVSDCDESHVEVHRGFCCFLGGS
jgi:hypothetical protein